MTRLLVLPFVALLLFGVSTAQTRTRVYLPVASGVRQTQPRDAYDLRPPDGITCFHSDVTVVEASDGAVFWNAQCMDGQRQNVFRTDAQGTRRVLQSSMGGRGSLFVGRDGWLYLAAGSFEADPPFTRVESVPGWAR